MPEKGEKRIDTDELRAELLEHQNQFWRFFAFLRRTVQKSVIWGVFFLILFLLRDFFALIFLTFVFSFVSTTAARALGRPFPGLGWKPRVIAIFSGFLLVLGLLVWLATPQVKTGVWQLQDMVQSLPAKWQDEVDPWLYENLGVYRRLVETEVPVEVEPAEDGAGVDGETPDEAPVGGEPPPPEPPGPTASTGADSAPQPSAGNGESPRTRIERQRLWEVDEVSEFLSEFETNSLKNIPNFVTDAVKGITAIFSLLFLSTLFSFLIVLDLDALRREVMKLEQTKLSEFYKETVLNIAKFGSVLGKVLEAQAVIALVNTLLTAVTLWVLGLPNVGFLSLFVFVCGFIPVAGVFISSVPICLIGLYHDGVGMMMVLILFITGIHFLEAYVLNPRIMGAALHINPVLVLIILVIGHHAIGVWGLLLGLPICYYFFTHVIKREDREIGLRVKFRKKGRAAT